MPPSIISYLPTAESMKNLSEIKLIRIANSKIGMSKGNDKTATRVLWFWEYEDIAETIVNTAVIPIPAINNIFKNDPNDFKFSPLNRQINDIKIMPARYTFTVLENNLEIMTSTGSYNW